MEPSSPTSLDDTAVVGTTTDDFKVPVRVSSAVPTKPVVTNAAVDTSFVTAKPRLEFVGPGAAAAGSLEDNSMQVGATTGVNGVPRATPAASDQSSVLDTPFNGALQPPEVANSTNTTMGTGSLFDQNALDTPVAAEIPVEPERHVSRNRILGLAVLGIGVLAAILLGIRIEINKSKMQEASLAPSARLQQQSTPLSILSKQLGPVATVSANNGVTVNGSLVLSPTLQPSNPISGQLYYDQTTNAVQYYDGTGYVKLQGGVTNNVYNNTSVTNNYGGGTTVNNFYSTTANTTNVINNISNGAQIQGTAGTLAMFGAGGQSLASSVISESGSTVSVAGILTLPVAADLRIAGSQIASINLADGTNLAKLNATQTFTGANTFQNVSNSTTTFQVNNASGSNELGVDTVNNAITLGSTSGTPTAMTVQGGAAIGSNLTGANLTIAPSNGTGSATSGNIIFDTGVSAENGIEFGATAVTHGTGTVTENATVGSQPNQLLLVSSDCPLSSLAYDGHPLIMIGSEDSANHDGSGAHIEMWYLVSPPVGTHALVGVNVNASCGQTGGGTLVATTYYNVSQTAPIGTPAAVTGTISPAQGTGTSTLPVSTTNISQIVVDALSTDRNVQPCGSTNGGQTLRWTSISGKVTCGSDNVANGSTFNVEYNLNYTDWSDIGVAINPAVPNSVPLFIASATTPDALYNRLEITANGNVGINNSTPQYTLDVAGTINASSAIYTPALDTAIPGTLNIGQFDATTIQLGNTTSNVPIDLQGTTLIKPTTGNDSTTEFQIQNAGGTPLLAADTTAMKITVVNFVATGNITVDGHIVTGGSAPTVAAGVAACTSPTTSISGDDTTGSITLTTGTGCSGGGDLATITFAGAFGSSPHVSLTPDGPHAASLSAYNDYANLSANGFSIGTSATPTASTTYIWNYWVAQ